MDGISKQVHKSQMEKRMQSMIYSPTNSIRFVQKWEKARNKVRNTSEKLNLVKKIVK